MTAPDEIRRERLLFRAWRMSLLRTAVLTTAVAVVVARRRKRRHVER